MTTVWLSLITVRFSMTIALFIPARRVHGPLCRSNCCTIPWGRACFSIVTSSCGFAFRAGLGVGLQIGVGAPGDGLLRFENRLPVLRSNCQALDLVEVAGTGSFSRRVVDHSRVGGPRRRSRLWIRVLPCLRRIVSRLPLARFARAWQVRNDGSARCGPALVVRLGNRGQWEDEQRREDDADNGPGHFGLSSCWLKCPQIELNITPIDSSPVPGARLPHRCISAMRDLRPGVWRDGRLQSGIFFPSHGKLYGRAVQGGETLAGPSAVRQPARARPPRLASGRRATTTACLEHRHEHTTSAPAPLFCNVFANAPCTPCTDRTTARHAERPAGRFRSRRPANPPAPVRARQERLPHHVVRNSRSSGR